MEPEKIFLTGFMGAGKTTLGRGLAARLGSRFEDLDDAIEAREGLSVARIFTERGEARFRETESRELARLAALPGAAVVACGGGAPLDPANRALMGAAGLTVWLDRPFDAIWRGRAELQPGRPLFVSSEAEARALFESRRPVYETAALRVPIGSAGIGEALDLLERLVRERGAH